MNTEVNHPYDYKVGGSLPPNHPTYIERKADIQLYQALKNGEFCYVLNARQMGKSSLMLRTLNRLEQDRFRCGVIDITGIVDQTSNSEEWYFGLIQRLNSIFQLNVDVDSWWYTHRLLAPINRLKLFFEDIILEKIKVNIIIFIDEIDSIIKFDFKDDFFSLIRVFYESRSNDPKYNGLTFAIFGVASPFDLMSNNAQTPFNIGQAIELEGFTLEETKPLWKGLEDKVDDTEAVMKAILEWTGGQPFLTQKICKFIQQDSNIIHQTSEKCYIEYLVKWKIINNWEYQDNPPHLRTIYHRLKHINDNSNFFKKYNNYAILRGIQVNSVKEDLELRLSGLMVRKTNELEVYNKIYRYVFENILFEFHQEKNLHNARNKIKLIQSLMFNYVLPFIGAIALIFLIDKKGIEPIFIRSSDNSQENPSLVNPPSSKITLEQRFSSGDRRLFVNKTNPKADEAIAAFKSQKYDQAKELFTEAVKADWNDPEVQVYLNNTDAKIKGTPFILAAVIPADTKVNNAETMLRGIADAQTKFNQKGLNNRLLEIIIVNDSNDATIAQQVAQKLSNNPSVLGVIGHNSSSATKSALTEYEKVKLSVISPTSTATNLQDNVFFRTVPSDVKIGIFLTKYGFQNKLDRVAIFYTSKSAYSISLTQAFVKKFQQLGEVKTFDMSNSDFNIQDTVKSLENKVDAIVLFPNTDKEIIKLSLQVAQANNNLSTPLKLLGGDTLYNADLLTFGDKAVEGLVLAVPWFAKENYPYAKIAEERWGGGINWRTAASYDATQAFIKALSKDATRQTILNNLKQTNISKEETSGESLQFFSNGDRATDPVLVKVIKGGKNRPEGSDYSFDIIK